MKIEIKTKQPKQQSIEYDYISPGIVFSSSGNLYMKTTEETRPFLISNKYETFELIPNPCPITGYKLPIYKIKSLELEPIYESV